MSFYLKLGWEKQKTTTSKFLTCLSIDLHLTKDNLGVTMLSSERFTGDRKMSYQPSALGGGFKQRSLPTRF